MTQEQDDMTQEQDDMTQEQDDGQFVVNVLYCTAAWYCPDLLLIFSCGEGSM